jgi:hypothetical protein
MPGTVSSRLATHSEVLLRRQPDFLVELFATRFGHSTRLRWDKRENLIDQGGIEAIKSQFLSLHASRTFWLM